MQRHSCPGGAGVTNPGGVQKHRDVGRGVVGWGSQSSFPTVLVLRLCKGMTCLKHTTDVIR